MLSIERLGLSVPHLSEQCPKNLTNDIVSHNDYYHLSQELSDAEGVSGRW